MDSHVITPDSAPSRWLALVILAVTAAARLVAQPSPAPADLSEASIEQLLNLEVVSASRKQQSLAQTPAAMFVLTAEDIRRSGALTIPEVLRLVPGLQVGRIDTATWAVSARGFNSEFANKLLVMIDGRSVYTPDLRRRLMGQRRRPDAGYRTNRGDSRTGRHDVGR